MKHVRMIAVLVMGLGVSGCASMSVVSRNASFEQPEMAIVASSVSVEGIQISVPKKLRVSEANLYYPLGDIVWRGDPMGDRHAQVKAIFEQGIGQGVKSVKGAVPVIAHIEVLRFHSLSEKARYSVGGVHSIKFSLTLVDPKTGAILVPARAIKADLQAWGGYRAMQAENQGEGQKVRIIEHLAAVIHKELTNPPAPEAAAKVANAKALTAIN